jgi:hypothetical protein
MTTYHRGRVQSPYRKRTGAVSLALTGTARLAFNSLTGQTLSGTRLIKSIRGLIMIPALGNSKYASGWVGYARSTAKDSSPSFDLAQSDVFGVQNWVVGPLIDQVLSLPLKGITLSAGEQFFLVAEMELEQPTTGTVTLLYQHLYAERVEPAA